MLIQDANSSSAKRGKVTHCLALCSSLLTRSIFTTIINLTLYILIHPGFAKTDVENKKSALITVK